MLWFIPILKCLKDWHNLRQKEPPELFYKKGVLKKLAKFTRKHMCQSIIIAMRNFIFMKIMILTFQSFNRREEKNKMDIYFAISL